VGYYYDPDTGKCYVRARDYYAVLMRWGSQDPIGLRADRSNAYRYVLNRPTTYFDPNGLRAIGTITLSMRHIQSPPGEGNLSQTEANIEWLPPDGWDLNAKGCPCKNVQLYQIVQTKQINSGGWDRFSPWHPDDHQQLKRWQPFISGVGTNASARLTDDPGLDSISLLWVTTTYLRQEFETGAVCIDPKSPQYLEVLAVVSWKQTWLLQPLERVFLTSISPWASEVRIDANQVKAQSYGSINEGPSPGTSPSQTFLTQIGTLLGGRLRW
jgi:RHS repeat-associated protein